MSDDRLLLRDMLACLDAILEYSRGGREAYLGDRRTLDAILRNLRSLGRPPSASVPAFAQGTRMSPGA